MILRGDEEADHSVLIAETVSRFAELGFLDDRGFAEARLRSFRRKGLSTRMVAAKLSEKGVDRETIEAVVAEDDTPEADAAVNYARRRRLGPWRIRDRTERRDKDIAAMMRAGFTYGLATMVIDGEVPADLLDKADPN
ncbi:regulatory protein RecX [Fulvimarina sp. 2208YS6-2-32]|uniref:Regulatory protein RecX n=1 Tax=Fulvimarina uroteuthidis TaxID=3098149 RepID=A0ABU5I6Q9_9HYPH|nr:regulatory protein RecX [Fulvimarina sp. 2208YS6-2-32]MDY8110438.1 regulatory protein RecX [Fulvimarina sp. 2208YS6-2-32]